jgi:hypothetical protein
VLPLRRLPLSAGVQPVGKRVMASYQPPAEKVFGWLGILFFIIKIRKEKCNELEKQFTV